MLNLTDIPGVGARMRERLIERYGAEEPAMLAIVNGDIPGLSSIMSERQAITLARWAVAMSHGLHPDDFLATDEAVRIYQALIQKIAKHAHTDYARLKISILFPSSSPELIAENRKLAETAIAHSRQLEGTGMDDLLRKIKPLREKAMTRVRGRAVAVESSDVLMQLKSRGLDKIIDLIMAENARELQDAARSYSHVCFIGDLHADADIERAECMDSWYLVPESILCYYSENMDSISAAVEASRILHEKGVCSFKGLEALEKLISRLALAEDEDSAQMARQLKDLSRSVDEAASWADSELKRRIEASSVTLEGMDILQALGSGEGVRELFEVKMKGVFQEVLKGAKARVASKLALSGPDTVYLDEIFSSEVQYPLVLDRQALHRFEQDLRSKIESRGLRSSRELARGLEDKKDLVREMISRLLEFDLSYALGSFALAEKLTMPEIIDDIGLGFLDGMNLFLENAEPVSYSLGRTGMIEHQEKIVLLSGVNSGGKTSLLDLVSQIVILAQMGLPVPASRCRLCIFQELYYFAKSRGTLSAGAFETAMRKFAVVENDRRKLVLADELEAITEPGASARIIGCMLDELDRRNSASIFVSHLAEEIRRFAESPVRVDGIEAAGLDENNNLVVHRTPRYNYLARSTPELILDRLVRTTTGPEKEFYSRILGRFQK